MSRSRLHDSTYANTSRHLLLGPPLTLVLLFCFGFVLLQQHHPLPAGPLATNRQASHENAKLESLSISPAAAVGQTTLNNVAPADSPAAAVAPTPTASAAANPQSSGAATPSLQTAPPNQPMVEGTGLKPDDDQSRSQRPLPVTLSLPTVPNLLNNLFSGHQNK